MRKDRSGRVAAHAALLPKYERMRALRASGAAAEDATARAALRDFAAARPGALKELDTLASDEIERRARACAEGAREPWMAWSLRYHELMRAALAIRRGEATDVDEAFARAVKRPRHGRLNVVVFSALERELGVPARDIWDTLFPPRGRAPRDYRR